MSPCLKLRENKNRRGLQLLRPQPQARNHDGVPMGPPPCAEYVQQKHQAGDVQTLSRSGG